MSSFVRNRTGFSGLLPGVLMMVLGLCACLPASSAQDKAKAGAVTDPAKVLATVNGKSITAGEVETAATAEFQQIDRQCSQQKHDLLESKLKQMVQDQMVEAEAKAKGVTKEVLLADATKASDVSDADVDKFYGENKAQIPPTMTKEQVTPRIKQYLQQQRQGEARQKFFSALEAKYKADYMIEPIRVAVDSNGFPAMGPANAPVTIVEFSDFQCPFCSRLKPTMEQVHAKYGDKVRIVFRQYPLPMHQNAGKAAEAALCANDQGKFWEMHNAMFDDQQGLAVDALKAKAAKLGLNAETFNSCLDTSKHADQVRADIAAGSTAGVSGTPAMFVNGRFISGAVPLDDITKVVDDELKHSGEPKAAAKSK